MINNTLHDHSYDNSDDDDDDDDTYICKAGKFKQTSTQIRSVLNMVGSIVGTAQSRNFFSKLVYDYTEPKSLRKHAYSNI